MGGGIRTSCRKCGSTKQFDRELKKCNKCGWSYAAEFPGQKSLGVQETSISAYRELMGNGTFNEQEAEVFKAFFIHGPCSDLHIENKTDLKSNIITGRRNDLVAKGFIKDMGTKPNDSGRPVHQWKAVTTPEVVDVSEDGEEPSMMSNKEMEKLCKIVRRANDFQKQKIMGWCME